eukprot:1157805-Pelagomonas_calceolata.AAC.18
MGLDESHAHAHEHIEDSTSHGSRDGVQPQDICLYNAGEGFNDALMTGEGFNDALMSRCAPTRLAAFTSCQLWACLTCVQVVGMLDV